MKTPFGYLILLKGFLGLFVLLYLDNILCLKQINCISDHPQLVLKTNDHACLVTVGTCPLLQGLVNNEKSFLSSITSISSKYEV